MKMRRYALCVVLLLVSMLVLLGGCSSHAPVHLDYAADRWAKPCRSELALSAFTDAREEKRLIVKGDEVLATDKDVAEWVTDALERELEARRVAVHPFEKDSPFAPEFALSGRILEAQMVVDGVEHRMDMSMQVVLRRGESVVLDKTYNGQWQRKDLPTRGTMQEMLSAALVDVLSNVLADVCERLQAS